MNISILDQFEDIVLANNSDKIALIDGDWKITFKDLAFFSKQIAIEIINKKVKKNEPIGVFLKKGALNVFADLGIIYAGCIYCNLDIRNPSNRIKSILENIKPKLLLTSKSLINSDSISDLDPETIIIVEEILNKDLYSEELIHNRRKGIIDTDPLCIINTSGSTGVPKGVVLNHRSFIDFTSWAIETLNIKEDEIIGSLSPFYFDIYSFELCLCLTMASTINIIPEQLASFPIKLVQYLSENRINFIFWVPTIMVNIANLDILSRIKLPDLRKVLFAGEVFPTKYLNYWRRNLNHVIFINLYGPIEITLDCTYYILDREFADDEPIPIGYPCKNTDILILNEKNEIAGIKEQGELWVRGTSLAMGYYNDFEKTKQSFVQNPLNHSYPELIYRTGDLVYMNDKHEIIFVGRKDFQVKHLGYRIELGEIEHIVVNSIEEIKNACVIYDYKRKSITLIYESDIELNFGTIREKLSFHLPKYMIPTAYHWFSELPRNPNGKIDRNKLNNELLNQ